MERPLAVAEPEALVAQLVAALEPEAAELQVEEVQPEAVALLASAAVPAAAVPVWYRLQCLVQASQAWLLSGVLVWPTALCCRANPNQSFPFAEPTGLPVFASVQNLVL